MRFILYGTDYCQLCDEALELVEQSLEGKDYKLDIVDISHSDELMGKYAYSIPVLKCLESDRELNWPFTGFELLAFTQSSKC
jgi:hypothetical protein|tara:strand:- start:318 stop:563 length:246 start_codon:yes stop_codon:yes gene_type:complete